MKNFSIILTTLIFSFFISSSFAQQPAQKTAPEGKGQHSCCQKQGGHCGNCPHHQQGRTSQAPAVNADGIAMEIVRAFPTVKSVKKESKYTSVFDGSKKLLGYAVYSKPASDGIKGYNGETPLMIALDKNKKVISVELLTNTETPKFVQRVKEGGLFKAWNGLSPKAACKKKVDVVAGATYTSNGVIQSLQAALKEIK